MKETLLQMSWINKSIITAVLFGAFPFLITSLAQKGMKPEVTLAWWFGSISVGMYTLSAFGGGGLVTDNFREFFAMNWSVMIVISLGATCGVVLSTFYGQAMHSAPNPALAYAVINSSVLFTYVLAPLLFKFFPKIFQPASISSMGLVGIILTVIGMILIVRSR